jgi:hypothetical protein
MFPSLLLQALSTPSDTRAVLVEAAVMGAIVGVGKLFDHRANKKRDIRDRDRETRERASVTQMNRIEESVAETTGEVRDLKAYVIGPDGQNGLRGDVREIKERVRGLEERERDQLHSSYDRRAKP